MLSKCFSYYNYKITQNIDIPILFLKKVCRNNPSGTLVKYAIPFFFYLTMVFTTLSPTRTITNP